MTRRKDNPGQIEEKLRDMAALQAEDHSIGEAAKCFEVSEQASHRWRNQFDDMRGEEMKRLVADLGLGNRMLRDLAEGNF